MTTNAAPKLRVSVGIPAYNEEANIGHLINSLLNQKGDNFILEEIIVISDGSTDNTAHIARSFDDARVTVKTDDARKGTALRQNEIADHFKGDALILLHADVLPADEYFIKKMSEPLIKDENTAIVAPVA